MSNVDKAIKPIVNALASMVTLGEYKRVLDERDELKAIVEEVIGVLPGGLEYVNEGDWYCPACQAYIGGARVTSSGHCDECGTYLEGGEVNADSCPKLNTYMIRLFEEQYNEQA